jgi:Na+/pantothenate symporter
MRCFVLLDKYVISFYISIAVTAVGSCECVCVCVCLCDSQFLDMTALPASTVLLFAFPALLDSSTRSVCSSFNQSL